MNLRFPGYPFQSRALYPHSSYTSQVNLNFYGYPATPRQLLLEGTVPQPPAAGMLYEGIKVGTVCGCQCRSSTQAKAMCNHPIAYIGRFVGAL